MSVKVGLLVVLTIINISSGLSEGEVAVTSAARVDGVEMLSLRGWFANIYPWPYFPEQTPFRPIPELFTPYQKQSVAQVQYQEQLLNKYGSALDVLQFDPSSSNDPAHWRNVYFPYSRRPFFVSYEHVFNGNYVPPVGPKNMDNPVNRQAFLKDVDFLFNNVIKPYQSRYVTVDGRAVIYMWSSIQMTGDFASLLEEARQKYPVFFIGSGEDSGDLNRVSAFDGLMEYSLAYFGGAANYVGMISNYNGFSSSRKSTLDAVESQTGKKIYSIPTFQAGYDDTLVRPPRGNKPFYPTSRDEVVEHARLIRLGMTRWRTFDNLGPFVVFSELPEGGAVLPTISAPEQSGKYVGYGTGRIDIVAQFFGRR